ncbi:MAG TPA: ABC transporter ATP-binding protein [Acidobacteriota bacterium]|nr:ABC transporter ATP-binding protein [Acidobacteriota bacterium]
MSYVSAQELCRTYGQVAALDRFTLDVHQGEIFALVGPDGSGKTTLIRILCGLLSPDSGTAMIAEHDVTRQFDHIKPLLGYMPQQFSLYPDLTVEENLVFYAGIYGVTGDAYRQKRKLLYEFSNLGPFTDRRAADLSGGMKQKLALSCALVHDPRLLILDEPTTGVDPLSRRQFWEILLTLRSQGVTVLVSTPYMDEVARADRACFVLGGRKLTQGTPQDLSAEFTGRIFYLDREPTTRLVEQVNHIEGLTGRRFGAGLHLYIGPGQAIGNYVDALGRIGVEVAELTAVDPSLEDRFIQLMEGAS